MQDPAQNHTGTASLLRMLIALWSTGRAPKRVGTVWSAIDPDLNENTPEFKTRGGYQHKTGTITQNVQVTRRAL